MKTLTTIDDKLTEARKLTTLLDMRGHMVHRYISEDEWPELEPAKRNEIFFSQNGTPVAVLRGHGTTFEHALNDLISHQRLMLKQRADEHEKNARTFRAALEPTPADAAAAVREHFGKR